MHPEGHHMRKKPSRLTRRITPGNKEAYRASVNSVQDKAALALEVRFIIGSHWEGKIIPYSQIRTIEYTGHQWLTIPCMEYLITLEGEHLDELLDDLQDQRVRVLQVFHPGYFEPPGEGEILIKSIAIEPR
jgi:hypothetical protein